MVDTPRPRDDDSAGFAKRLREAWMKTVGHFATDDGGTRSLLARLVEFRQLSAEESRKVLADVRHRIDDNRAELDTRVDASIQKTVQYFANPSPKEVRKLEARVVELEARLRELESSGARS